MKGRSGPLIGVTCYYRMTKHSQISVSTCNINVLHHKTIDDKTTNKDFVNSIKHHVVILLTETWSDTATVISDFISYF